MIEDDYSVREFWECYMDLSIFEEVWCDMWWYWFEWMNDFEDLRRELCMWVMDFDDDDYFFEEYFFVFCELSYCYMIEVEEICDFLELKKCIDDFDVLLVIFFSGYECDWWWGWYGWCFWKDEFWRVGVGYRKFFIFSSYIWNSDVGILLSREWNKLVFMDFINLIWGYEF